MEKYLTPQVLIPVLVVGLTYFVWWFFKGRKKPHLAESESGPENHYKDIDAIIYDRTTTPFTWYETKIPKEEVKKIIESKNLGLQVTYLGKKVFRFFKLLGADNVAFYEGVTDPMDVKNSPIAAYIDMQHPYTERIDDMTVDKGFMQKYGHLLIWLGVIAFLIVLVINSK